MNNINRYDFGTSLRDVVMYGIDEKKESDFDDKEESEE